MADNSFKLIIAGSRDIDDPEILEKAIQKLSESPGWREPTEIVSGTARGVDSLGESWAAQRGIHIVRFPADWKRYGKGAGHRRNQEMVDYSHALLLVWDGKSPGSHDIWNRAKIKKILVFEHLVNTK